MRKSINSVLVVIITVLTIFAMRTFNRENISETSIMEYGIEGEVSKPEDAGYIFDDFNKGINIPINDKEQKKTPTDGE